MRQKLILLDRDGVINHNSDSYIKSPDEWRPIMSSLQAIAKLNAANYKVAVVTNQSGIARGFFDEAMLEKIHQKLHKALKQVGGHIDKLVYCPHHPDDQCQCRKPQLAMLKEVADYFQTDLAHVPFVGDAWCDIQAATNAGCPPILVLTGHGEKTKAQHPEIPETQIFTNLEAVVESLLNRSFALKLQNSC